jgi:rod shape-determining protein MreC
MCQNQKSRYSNTIFGLLILIGFFFIIGRFSAPINLIKTLVYYVAYPNLHAANYIFRSAGSFADSIKAMVYLRQENIAYKQKNQELTDKLRNYNVMSQEYENLSKLLKIEKINNTRSVFAKISVRESCEWYQCLIIDKGEDNGLYKDLPVVMFNKGNDMLCAVGRIIETYQTSSKVALITNPIYVLPVEIKDKGINCLAEGFDSNLLKITHIPLGADIKRGDEVVVSGLSSVFQKGMRVGVIKDVIDETSVYFKTATAEVFFGSNTLHNAIILVPQADGE